MMDHKAPETLPEALDVFSMFLKNNGYPEQILWVGKNDVAWDRRQLRIRVRPLQKAWQTACETYTGGIKRRLGVSLYAFSSIEGMTIATVLVPENEDMAQRSRIPPDELKLSTATNSLPACRVTSRLVWLALSLCHRRSSRLFRTTHLTCT